VEGISPAQTGSTPRAEGARLVDADAAIIALARRQHGLVHVRQLRALRLDSRAIRRRIARSWLVDDGDGLFRVGPIAGPLAREMGAILRYGSQSVVSDGAALACWELRDRRPSAPVDVTVASGAAGRSGVRVHRRRLTRDEWVTRDGVRLTTPARTIADLAPSLPAVDLQRLVEEAQLRRLATRKQLTAYGRGRPALRAALAAHDEPQLTRSEAERRLLELVRAAGLPRPRTNARVLGMEVDMLWPAERLIVEVDGFATHGPKPAFERDRRRDGRLLAAGYRVLRVTWRQIVEEPAQVIAWIAATLAV
jgi:very-short-patch-repair endonuclease